MIWGPAAVCHHHEVVGRDVGRNDTRSSQAGRAVVGRAVELSIVQAALDTAGGGRPTIVLLTGEAGIGKTRLADEAAVMARASGMRVLRGEADGGRREPMELWQGVHRALGTEPGGDPSLPAEERRWDHLESIADALISCGPTLVVLEDLHWADPIAIWVLDHLPRTLGDAPVAIVATSRDHERDMPSLDGVRRVARVVPLAGLDIASVHELAAGEGDGGVDAAALHARTGGNPLFVQELVRSPDGGGVIGEVLDRSLDRFDDDTRAALGAAAVAGAGTPLAVIARSTSCAVADLIARLEPAVHEHVVDEVTADGVRFHHALLADAAARRVDVRETHRRLVIAWEAVDTLDGRAGAAAHRLRAADGAPHVAEALETARGVAAELVGSGRRERAVGLLHDARAVGATCLEHPDLRANLALDLARALRGLGDLEPALRCYEEAAELARDSADPVTRARAEVGANLWADAFVPDPARVRRLEDVLTDLPAGELHLRATLLGRLTVVGGADPDTGDQVRAWADEAVDLARTIGDPVLVAQALINQTMSPATRDELDARITAAEEVVRLAEHAGRSDLALHGHQRCVSHHLNHGDVGAANHSLTRAELLAELLPGPGWRQRTLVQRTTLLALTGNRAAASAAMYEAARVGVGHIEPVMLVGCETLHHLMLLDLYGHADPRAREAFDTVSDMVGDLPSAVLQVQRGFGAQLFDDEATVHEMLLRYATHPERLLRSMTGDHLLRVVGDTVARSGAVSYAEPVYRALLPYAGLLNVGGAQCAGLPVDDVLGRLALLGGDVPAAVRHARAAVSVARTVPSSPLLVHCLDHLADALDRLGDDGADASRAEADERAREIGVERPEPTRPTTMTRATPPTATMRRDAAQWVITSPLGDARLADTNGMGQLARLLTTPGVEVAAVELAGRASTPVAAGLGPGLDSKAKRAYRQRLLELQAEVDDAESANDVVRGERAHAEMDALVRELKRAVGLGGRDRPTGSDAERARINVARSLRRAVAAVADQAPLLGAHLEESVRTGGFCIYLPDPAAALTWTVDTAA